VLPHLESTLPLAIPAPVFSGRASDAYPWPFLGSRYLPGSELGSAELNEDAEVTLAGTLGHCLSAVDLQLVWSFFSAGGRAAFVRAYGPVADERLLRARVFAFSICSALALYGHDESRAEIQGAALAGLERAAED
jgi:hypothetical protein